MADRGGDGAALEAEAGDEGAADVAVPAVAGDDGDLGKVAGRIGEAAVALRAHLPILMRGDDLSGLDADHRNLAGRTGDDEVLRGHRRGLHGIEADGSDPGARREEGFIDDAAGGNHHLHVAGGQVAD